mmetsp:Transcript_3058/g.8880  ORF Transcript_3058/g.8880 Transcript_3058/m.8880 type:complete len:233 (-) Transcript_3058:261-959(-)
MGSRRWPVRFLRATPRDGGIAACTTRQRRAPKARLPASRTPWRSGAVALRADLRSNRGAPSGSSMPWRWRRRCNHAAQRRESRSCRPRTAECASDSRRCHEGEGSVPRRCHRGGTRTPQCPRAHDRQWGESRWEKSAPLVAERRGSHTCAWRSSSPMPPSSRRPRSRAPRGSPSRCTAAAHDLHADSCMLRTHGRATPAPKRCAHPPCWHSAGHAAPSGSPVPVARASTHVR